MSPGPLSLNPLPVSSIPDPSDRGAYRSFLEEVTTHALAIIDDTRNWTRGKSRPIPGSSLSTQTWTRKPQRGASGPSRYDEAAKHGWHARSTVLPAGQDAEGGYAFDELWPILNEHSTQGDLPTLKKASMIAALEPGVAEIWNLQHRMPVRLLKDRDFVQLIITRTPEHSATGLRNFLMVSIPAEDERCPPTKDFVRGKFVCVEQIREVLVDGEQRVEWRVAASSDPGGLLPAFAVEAQMPKSIYEDSAFMFSWLEARRGSQPQTPGSSVRSGPSSSAWPSSGA